MRVVVLGANGYIGHYLTQKLKEQGHDVFCADNFMKEEQLMRFGFISAVPYERNSEFLDILDYYKLLQYLDEIKPEIIFNLAQQPAPTYSMISIEKAAETVMNNVGGTINLLWAIKRLNLDAPVIQIGTLGEYGYYKNNKTIKDGTTFVEHGTFANASIYHVSKCCSTLYAKYLSNLWKLRVIDIQQTVVEGAREGVPLYFDWVFGTVVNRTICQAICGKILIYGSGQQTRSMLSIEDSVRALLTVMKHAHDVEGYLSINQLDPESVLSCNEIANIVKCKAEEHGIEPEIEHIPNPRVEEESAKPNVEMRILFEWGFKPKNHVKEEIEKSFDLLMNYKDRIKRFERTIYPKRVEGWNL